MRIGGTRASSGFGSGNSSGSRSGRGSSSGLGCGDGSGLGMSSSGIGFLGPTISRTPFASRTGCDGRRAAHHLVSMTKISLSTGHAQRKDAKWWSVREAAALQAKKARIRVHSPIAARTRRAALALVTALPRWHWQTMLCSCQSDRSKNRLASP